jgi:plastocyanin
MKRLCSLMGAVLTAAALAACTSQSDTADTKRTDAATASATATSPAADGPMLTIANMGFGGPVTVSPGAQITIRNDDSVEHSVTSRTSGQFDVHVDGKKQGTLTAPSAPGQYAFYCVYHPSMTGTLIVK